ncbi:MAG TPA: serine protease [Conexibacter sp.]|nr:serine protease [Conexibacter sp.]
MAAPDPQAAHVVRLRHADGQIVGAGLHVGGGRIVTCAHVVRLAAGRGASVGAAVKFDLPLDDHQLRTAHLREISARSDGGADDVAVLQADEPATLPTAPRLRTAPWRGQRVRALGFPTGHDEGVWAHGRIDAPRSDGAIQWEGDASGAKVRPGFSGTPAWNEETGALAGIVTGYDSAPGSFVAFVIPLERLPLDLDRDERQFEHLTEGVGGLRGVPGSNLEGFLIAYLGTAPAPVPFGGRGHELAALDTWLASPAQRALLVRPPGRGKSALVTRWAASLGERADVAFLPVNLSYGTSLRRDAFALLGARLAFLGGVPLDRRDSDEWLGAIDTVLRTDRGARRPLVVVIDGVDEAADWSIGTDLRIPAALGDGVKVLVVARPVAGCDEAGWRKAVGWSAEQVTSIELPTLDDAAVREVIADAHPALAHGPVADELARLSDGDPLVLSLYLGAIADDPGLDAAALRRLDPGLDDLVARLVDELGPLMPDLDTQRGVDALLSALASALGPVRRTELLTIAGPSLDGALFDRALRAARRLVVGDGHRTGLALAHPRLAQLIRERRMTDATRGEWDERYAAAGIAVLDALEAGAGPASVSSYAIEHLGAHLLLVADAVEASRRLVGPAWATAWETLTGTFDGFVRDVERVLKLALEHHEDALAVRCLLVRGSLFAVASSIRPATVRQLVLDGRWSYAQALAHARVIDRERWRAPLLQQIADLAPDGLLAETEQLARQISRPDHRAIALAALSERADHPDLFDEALALARELSLEHQVTTLSYLARHGPVECPPLDELIATFLEACRRRYEALSEDFDFWLTGAKEVEEERRARQRGEPPPSTPPPPWLEPDEHLGPPALARELAVLRDHSLPSADVERQRQRARQLEQAAERCHALATLAVKAADAGLRRAVATEAYEAVPSAADGVAWAGALLELRRAEVYDVAELEYAAWLALRHSGPLATARFLADLPRADPFVALSRQVEDDRQVHALVLSTLQALDPADRAPIADFALWIARMHSDAHDARVFALLLPVTASKAREARLREAVELLLANLTHSDIVSGTTSLLEATTDAEQRMIAREVWTRWRDLPPFGPYADPGECELLALLAPLLDASSQRELLDRVVARQEGEGRAEALGRLATNLDGALGRRAWRRLLEIAPAESAAFVMAIDAVGATLSPAQLDELRARVRATDLRRNAALLELLAGAGPDEWLDEVHEWLGRLPTSAEKAMALLELRARMPQRAARLLARASRIATRLIELPGPADDVRIDAIMAVADATTSKQRRRELVESALALGRAQADNHDSFRIELRIAVACAADLGCEQLARETVAGLEGTFAYGPAAMALAAQFEGEARVRIQRAALAGALAQAGRTSAREVGRDGAPFQVVGELADEESFDSRELWTALVPSLAQWERKYVIHMLTRVTPTFARLGGPTLLQRTLRELEDVLTWLS